LLSAAPVLFAAEAPSELDEVVVTAQRERQFLHEAPISLAVLTDEQLRRDGVTSLVDIKESVPSLSIEPFPTDNSNLKLFIRGIGIIDTQVTQDAPVAVYLDDIYIARASGLAIQLAELERIEVLRGPQGTLYGRNSTGGTVNLVTRDPVLEAWEFRQELSAGNRNYRHSRSIVNMPLGERAAAKLSYLHNEKDGFVENTGPGDDFGDQETRGWRIETVWQSGEAWSLSYAYENVDHNFVNMQYQPVRPKDFEVTTDYVVMTTQVSAAIVEDDMPYTPDDEINTSMSTVAPMQTGEVAVKSHRFSVDYEPEGYTARYIVGYRDLYNKSWSDLGSGSTNPNYRLDGGAYVSPGGMASYPAVPLEVLSRQWTHEAQLRQELWDGQIAYTLGLYYFEEQGGEFSEPLHHQFSAPLVDPTRVGAPPAANAGLVAFVSERFEIDNEAFAAYGRIKYTPRWLDDRWSFSAGYRHSEDTRFASKYRENPSFVSISVNDPATGEPMAGQLVPAGENTFNGANSKRFRDNSFETVVRWEASESLSVYGKVAEAYKSGGFNMRDPEEAYFERGFDEEKARVYEVGLRSQLWNRRARLNLTAFQTDIDDLQINFTLQNFADTRAANAGEARTRGGELDLSVLVTPDVLFSGSYAYLDAQMRSITDPETGEDATDDYVFPAAPRHMSNATVEWTFLRKDWGQGRVSVTYNYMDERNGGAKSEVIDDTFLERYELYNARVGLFGVPVADGLLDVSVWGKNLKDRVYVVNAIDQLPQASRAVYFGEPRSYGIDLRWSF
jgi:iron complex outermembrane receptor protein